MEMLEPECLKKNLLFENLDIDEIEKVIGLAKRQTYNKGDFVFLQDDEARKLYVVENGLVNIILEIRSDTRLTIATESRGGVLGWRALLPPHRYSASAKCFEPCQLIALDGTKLRELCYQQPQLGVKLMEGLARLISTRLNHTNLAVMEAMWK